MKNIQTISPIDMVSSSAGRTPVGRNGYGIRQNAAPRAEHRDVIFIGIRAANIERRRAERHDRCQYFVAQGGTNWPSRRIVIDASSNRGAYHFLKPTEPNNLASHPLSKVVLLVLPSGR
ncbi:hypothetical protein [Bradyrhizobium rifense]|uniref:hypothetical protein n=1 Tax=Bradyrhizobium rifense TaxID=515499 RepID=UPI001652DE4B|nr:hypothetical protein [Bradyrhizobium rifense]